MTRYKVWAIAALVAGILLAYFVWATEANPESKYRFKLGLDLAGGTELVYKADMSATPAADRAGALGQTPTLDFELATTTGGASSTVTYIPTGLTGRYLKSASVQFASGASAALASPQVLLNFDSDGAKLFEKITSENVGQTLAIFLDGTPISTPVIQEAIPGGTAVITGTFTPVEARDLANNLNFGALPVPISLESSSSVGPTLGAAAIAAGVIAGLVGFAIVALFMIVWYRFAGLIAAVALAEYLALMLSVIKVVPVTLTASGIAGLIISLGMAVDANVLIFERTKEELKKGETPREAVNVGFARAWTAIRDGHLTMLISGVILFWLGTSIVQGFALVFVLGVLASLISAVSLSRVFLLALVPNESSKSWRFLLGSGFRSDGSNTSPQVK